MSQPRYEALGVDWDGTLQNTLLVWMDACQCHLLARNISLHQKIVAQEITPHLDEAARYGVQDLAEFVDSVVLQALPLLPMATINLELWHVLQAIKQQGVQQSVISSSPEDFIARAMQHHHMDPTHFTSIVARENAARTKPHPDPIFAAAKNMRVQPKQLALIDDSPAGILAGQRAGSDTIWFYPPENDDYYDYQTMKDLGPTYIARSAHEVAQIVLNR